MSRKTLLVLAASRYQLDTIRTARRLGYRVVTTDNVPSNPGHALADQSYNVDIADLDGVLQIAIDQKVNGIIAACTDVGVPTAAYVAEKLGLKGAPYKSARILTNKESFRAFLINHGIPVPENFGIDAAFIPPREIFDRGPWILKPDQSSGSKGVFIVESVDEYERYFEETLSFSPEGRGILERFVDGIQGTCEGILLDGEIARAFFLDRQTVDAPYVATCGHNVPTLLPRSKQDAVLARVSQVWKKLRITDGPFDCDFVVGSDEIYILEMSPRIGGNSISTLLRSAAHFDIVEHSVREACGENPRLDSNRDMSPTAIVIFGTSEAGLLMFDSRELRQLMREPWVENLSMDLPIGAHVQPFVNGRNRVGEALLHGRHRDELDYHVREVRRRLTVTATSVRAALGM